MGDIKEEIVLRFDNIAPHLADTLGAVTAVGSQEPIQELIAALQGEVETTPVKGTHHGRQMGVRFSDGFIHIPQYTQGYDIEGRHQFQGCIAAKISENLAAFGFELHGTLGSVVIDVPGSGKAIYFLMGGHENRFLSLLPGHCRIFANFTIVVHRLDKCLDLGQCLLLVEYPQVDDVTLQYDAGYIQFLLQ